MESREALERFERAEEVAEEREEFARHAAILVAIVAALLAVAALFNERYSEHILLYQGQASDAYNELEANSLKKHIDGNAAAELRILAPGNPTAAALAASLQKGVDTKYEPKETGLLAKAQDFEKQRDDAEAHHTVLQWAEGLFQLAIVLTTVSIVARSRRFVVLALLAALVGLVMLGDGFLLFLRPSV